MADVHNSKGRHEIDVTFPIKTIQVEALGSHDGKIWPIFCKARREHLAAAFHKLLVTLRL
jgi:hypothetical protein